MRVWARAPCWLIKLFSIQMQLLWPLWLRPPFPWSILFVTWPSLSSYLLHGLQSNPFLLHGLHSHPICYMAFNLILFVTWISISSYLLHGLHSHPMCYTYMAFNPILFVTWPSILSYFLHGLQSHPVFVTCPSSHSICYMAFHLKLFVKILLIPMFQATRW